MVLGALMAPGIVSAQTDQSKTDTAAVKPDSTSSVFGDWATRCKRNADGAMTCEAAQYVHLPNQRQPAAQIILRKAGPDWSMTIEVAPDVALQTNMSIELGGETKAIDTRWMRCQAASCVAHTQLPAAVVDDWMRLTDAGRFSFLNAAGQKIVFPVSPHGLSEALQSFPQT